MDSLSLHGILPQAGSGSGGGSFSHVQTVDELAKHTHIQNVHNHTQNSHNHAQNAHTHVQDAHTHTQNSHNHTQNSHNHSQNSHYHYASLGTGSGERIHIRFRDLFRHKLVHQHNT